MDCFLHQASFVTGNRCCDRHRSVRLVIMVGLAIDQVAQSGLSSLKVIYYSAQLFSVILKLGYITKPLSLSTVFIVITITKPKRYFIGAFAGALFAININKNNKKHCVNRGYDSESGTTYLKKPAYGLVFCFSELL